MVTLLRRFLVLAALMFWQGGFTFYAAVVVPIGQDVLGSHLDQGFITRRVTQYLNLATAVALLPLLWDTGASRDPAKGRRRLRWLCWLVMAATLAALAWLHPRMEALLDPDAHQVLYHKIFRTQHRWYLWISTVQWGVAILYAGLTLASWRAEDRLAV